MIKITIERKKKKREWTKTKKTFGWINKNINTILISMVGVIAVCSLTVGIINLNKEPYREEEKPYIPPTALVI